MARKDDLLRLGAITQKRERMKQLDVKIDGIVKEINYHLFPSDGPDSVNYSRARQLMEELGAALEEWKRLKAELKELEG